MVVIICLVVRCIGVMPVRKEGGNMEVTEVGYYWYRHNGSLVETVVMVDKDIRGDNFGVWFFGSEFEMSMSQAENRGTFLRKVER
jgi:hypothetical protein